MITTVAQFNALVDAYQHTRQQTQWVMKNLDAPAIQTPEMAKVAYVSAMDQEAAALRDVVVAARGLRVKE